MRSPKKWQDDKPFVAWLDEREYRGNLTEGLILYMWEAWRAGGVHARA